MNINDVQNSKLDAVQKPAKSKLNEWIDNQDVMQALHISQRSLQNLRSSGVLPYAVLCNKCYYRVSDVEALLLNSYSQHLEKGEGV